MEGRKVWGERGRRCGQGVGGGVEGRVWSEGFQQGEGRSRGLEEEQNKTGGGRGEQWRVGRAHFPKQNQTGQTGAQAGSPSVPSCSRDPPTGVRLPSARLWVPGTGPYLRGRLPGLDPCLHLETVEGVDVELVGPSRGEHFSCELVRVNPSEAFLRAATPPPSVQENSLESMEE